MTRNTTLWHAYSRHDRIGPALVGFLLALGGFLAYFLPNAGDGLLAAAEALHQIEVILLLFAGVAALAAVIAAAETVDYAASMALLYAIWYPLFALGNALREQQYLELLTGSPPSLPSLFLDHLVGNASMLAMVALLAIAVGLVNYLTQTVWGDADAE